MQAKCAFQQLAEPVQPRFLSATLWKVRLRRHLKFHKELFDHMHLDRDLHLGRSHEL